MEVLLSPANTQIFVDTTTGVVTKEEDANGPLYYNYSEQFVREQILEPEVNPIQSGLAKSIKTTQEERKTFQRSVASAQGPRATEMMQTSSTAVPGIVELPASPVARRITREMILQGLEPVSTTGDVTCSTEAIAAGRVEGHQASNELRPMHTRVAIRDEDEGTDQRFSILSQADSSVVDSSTLEFAVRYSIPMVTGGQLDADVPPLPTREPPLPPDAAASTDMDMSDLLAGYQHTESKHEDETNAKNTEKKSNEASQDRVLESRSSHAHKSSDAESFKSATDVLESEPSEGTPEENDDDANSYSSCADAVVGREVPIKEVDAHSFRTAPDAVTPGRSTSMPVKKPLPSAPTESTTPRPKSEAPLPVPAPAVLRKPRVPPRETSFPLSNKLRASSKQSIKQGSVSISGSSSTLSTSQQPPLVPPRESSTSQEAQRSMKVASWMLFKRWGKKSSKDEGSTKTRNSSRATLSEARPTNSVTSLQQSLSDTIKTPEKALCKEDRPLLTRQAALKDCTPPNVHNASVVRPVHQRASSGPEPLVAEPSSVYSSDNGSTESRVQSMPASILKPAGSQRDSQTTTHLAWHGRRSPSLEKPEIDINEPHPPLPHSNDDTTTNLRLSQYRYPGPSRHLPGLKEESHEESSLNLSAGNPKASSFRFPFGVPGGVRASTDDGALFARRSSKGSYRKSALGSAKSQTHGLPSMNFSDINLFEKVYEVLHPHNSRSLDHLAGESPEQQGEAPQRRASDGAMRKKYRSFCDKLDQLDTPQEVPRPKMTSLLPVQRARSPQLLAEIEQVTVPSVHGLTERLSELLPSMKDYYQNPDLDVWAADDMIMETAMEHIHAVGGPVQQRSSARLRPLKGSPNMVIVDDALYNQLINKGEESGIASARGRAERAQGESRASASTVTKTPIAELEAPSPSSPTLPRPRALTVGHHGLRASVESGLTKRSLRSFSSTPTQTDTRPWNLDKNYPWAISRIPSIDISLPSPTAVRHSPRPGPSHLRNNLSTSSTVSTSATPVASPLGNESDFSAHARQLHRFSGFGRSGDQPHAVGERYPTSALTPPTRIFRDNFSASDTSDDDTEPHIVRKGKFDLKKRFSSARAATLETSAQPTNSKSVTNSNEPLELAPPDSAHRSAISIFQDTAGEAQAFTSNRHTFRDAQGMPTVVYHRHRLIDHLKRWWHKGGDLIRSLSRRSSSTRSRD